MENIEIKLDEFTITTDKSKLDMIAIHDFLSKHSGWSKNIPFERVKTSIENSLNFGLFHKTSQIGFARVISDFSTIAYLGDVYVLEEFRGLKLSKWIMDTIMNHPNLQGLRRWILLTADAHELYRQFGWTNIEDPSKWMELHDKNVYAK